ncbi:peptidylprolyl isomerase [Acinetobacter sp. ANC 4558]|uniref:peptidylprolyl isomerase n=1 Tax=Acinetobacter sp. ANC 4558 TaxID=1977876 RepID=UPI000A33AB91|nr:peptidylprolyl isomerase [Acinetobacter sp. ANC 4558]OTG86073.1 peptidylprolyl isomerase [Acinetobacter sp. ANC 4558]
MKTKQLQQFFKASIVALSIVAASSASAQSSDEIVAIVDNNVILRSDLAHSIEEFRQHFENNKQTPPEAFIAQQALEQLILREAQLEQVKKFNINADEKSLNEAILGIAKQAGSPSIEAFQKKLDAQNPGAYEALRYQVAEDLAINHLRQQIVMSRIQISDQDINNFLKTPQGQAALGNQAHIMHLKISGENAKQVAQQVQDALNTTNDISNISQKFTNAKTFVTGNDLGYRNLSDIPSELVAEVSTLNIGQTTQPIQVRDDFHVLKLVDLKSSDQKALVPQYNVRHILIQPSEVVSQDNAKQMIDSIYNRLKAGEDFAVLASTFSNDPGSARDGGSLGWVNLGVMVPEFENQMKNTPIGTYTTPFQSQFGWHILEVVDTRQQDMTKEYQKNMARQVLGERQFDAEVDNWLREVRNNAYVDIKDPSLNPKTNN